MAFVALCIKHKFLNIKRIIMYLPLFLFILFLPISSTSAPSICDPQLKSGIDLVSAYKMRPNDSRCEGVYQQITTTAALEIVGLVHHPLAFEIKHDKIITISAPEIHEAVLIRAEGIPLRSYYRMDAVLAPGAVFHWPLELLAQIKLNATNVGIFGRLQGNPDIYVPLRLQHPDALQEPEDTPQLILRATENLSSVNWRYAEANNGQCGKMRHWLTLDAPRGFRSGQPISVPLPEVDSPQLCIEVVAQPRFGKDWLQQLWRIQRREE
jgi:hypothetical protein